MPIGIFRRRAGDDHRQQDDQRPQLRRDDCPVPVLLVLDDLAELLDLVAGRRGTRAMAAAEQAEQLRGTRRELWPPEHDPDGLGYGQGEWLRMLCWLLSDQDLVGLYEASWPAPPRP